MLHKLIFKKATGSFLAAVFMLPIRLFCSIKFLSILEFRADGNSTFGENIGLQYYPKAGVAYNISEESISLKVEICNQFVKTTFLHGDKQEIFRRRLPETEHILQIVIRTIRSWLL
jgi:hypothetical protein